MAFDQTQNSPSQPRKREETLDQAIGYAERAFFQFSAGLGDERRDRILNDLLSRVEQKRPFAFEAGELLVRTREAGFVVNGQVENRYDRIMSGRPRNKPAPNKVPRRKRTPDEKAAAKKRLEQNRLDRAAASRQLTASRTGSNKG